MYEVISQPCSKQSIDEFIALLETTPSISISVSDYQDDPILEPLPGETPWWEMMVVHALFDDASDALIAQSLLTSHYPTLSHTLTKVPEKNWERVCLEHFSPQRYGEKLWVCPSWQTPPEPDQINLILDPGLAFGTGTHPTTALCLTWLDQANLVGKIILDYGCGSGILSLAALKLGAIHAEAIDIDEQALLATRENAKQNQIPEASLVINTPENLQASKVDILIANILLGPLTELKSTFHNHLKPDGILVVSGLYATQVPALLEAYAPLFQLQTLKQQDEWSMVIFTPVV